MFRKKRVSRAELTEELEQKLTAEDGPELHQDMERLSLQSAAFLLGDPNKPPEADMLDREQAEKLADQIMRKTDPNYMQWNYGNLGTSCGEKHFEGLLLMTVDGLTLPKGVDPEEKKETLRKRIEERGPTYAEYLLMNTARTPEQAEYRERDGLDCDSPVSEKTGRIFAALTHCMCRNAGLPAPRGADLDREARVYAGMPLCSLTLRNRRTAEMLERREFGSVAVALKGTRDAFQFSEKADFQAAQKEMRPLLDRMREQKYGGAQGIRWNALRQAAKGFTEARYRINNADAVNSAKLFLAAEAFLREGKPAPGDPGTELALELLAVGIPDAPRNPGVKALVDSLNERRAPGEKPIALPDRGAPPEARPPQQTAEQTQTGTAPAVRTSGAGAAIA